MAPANIVGTAASRAAGTAAAAVAARAKKPHRHNPTSAAAAAARPSRLLGTVAPASASGVLLWRVSRQACHISEMAC